MTHAVNHSVFPDGTALCGSSEKPRVGAVTCPACRMLINAYSEDEPVGVDTFDAICAVIDRVKTDERQLDTTEYAAMIEEIIRKGED